MLITKDDVGKKVWSITRGWGKISKFIDNNKYSVTVLFKGVTRDYISNGNIVKTDIYPELRWQEVEITDPPKPKEKVTKRYWAWMLKGNIYWFLTTELVDEDGFQSDRTKPRVDWDICEKKKIESIFVDVEVDE